MGKNIKDLDVRLQIAFTNAAEDFKKHYPNDPQPILTCTHRSNEEQNDLYAQGRTKPGKIVTNAKAGQSPHNFLPARAFDIAFVKPGNLLDWNPELFKKFATLLANKRNDVRWVARLPALKITLILN